MRSVTAQLLAHLLAIGDCDHTVMSYQQDGEKLAGLGVVIDDQQQRLFRLRRRICRRLPRAGRPPWRISRMEIATLRNEKRTAVRQNRPPQTNQQKTLGRGNLLTRSEA